jgi:hypothetical protein
MKKAANQDAVRLLTDAHPSSVQQAGASLQRPPQPQRRLPSNSAAHLPAIRADVGNPSQATLAVLDLGDAGPSNVSNALVPLPRPDGASTSHCRADAIEHAVEDGGSHQCTALVPIPTDATNALQHNDSLVPCPAGGAGATQHSTALVIRTADAVDLSQREDAAVPAALIPQPPVTDTTAQTSLKSGRRACETGKPDTPAGNQGTECTALVQLPKCHDGAASSELVEVNDDEDSEGSEYDNDEEDDNVDVVEVDVGKAGQGKKGSRRRRGRGRPKGAKGKHQGLAKLGKQKKSQVDASLEAEFALAMLENNSLREIVDLLKISRAELPAMSADEARNLLAASTDPLAEAHAKRAEELQSIEEARLEPRADDATLLRVARFLEVQNGTDLELVSQPLARIITEDMQQRARELEKQNADILNVHPRDKKRKHNAIRLKCALHSQILLPLLFAAVQICFCCCCGSVGLFVLT